MRINLHNHTRFCDGKATAEQVIRAAIAAGLTHVAITDHFDSEKLRPMVGITAEGMEEYAGAIKTLAATYADRITVLSGVEVDFSMYRTNFQLFDSPEAAEETFAGLDFVLFEYVNNPPWGGDNLDLFLDLRRNIPLPVGLAHPDLLLTFFGLSPGTAARLLREHDVFLELCPSMRNAVLVPPQGADPDHFERMMMCIHGDLEKVQRLVREEPQNPTHRVALAELQDEIRRLNAQCERTLAYRVPYRFVDDFFAGVRAAAVRLSIGTDSHDRANGVADIEDAVRFVQEQHLEANLITEHLWKR